ncbi:MAG: hypothetical protein K2F70_02490, partial [Muribaculaceae bacterium]|nr:hypothetical protein [Muribaculaceae bacterium]
GPTTVITRINYNTEFPLTFEPLNGYELTQVKAGDKIYTPVNGVVTLDHSGLEATYEVTCVPYERTQDFTVNVGPTSGGSLAVILSPKHAANRQWVYLEPGQNTIKVHPNDFPISLASSQGCVYVNGSKVEPDADGYYFAQKPAAGQDIRLYESQVSTVPVKVTNQSGKNCTITIDGKTVTAGTTVEVLPGSQVVVTPTTTSDAANLMLVTGTNYNSYVLQSGNKFTYTVNKAADLTLRPKAIVTLALDANWKELQFEESTTGEIITPKSQNFTTMLPYISGASATTSYTLKVYDPSKIYILKEATGSPSTGFSYSIKGTVTFRSGTTVTITTQKSPKPYYVNIHVAPGDNYYNYKYNSSTGLYESSWSSLNEVTNLICVKNGVSYGGGMIDMGDGNYMPSPLRTQSLLRYGDNNYNRDYTTAASNFSGSASPDFYETFNLDESEFPLTIYNASELSYTYNSVYVVEESSYGTNINEVYQGNTYQIEKPADGSFTVDVYLSFDYNLSNSKNINFNTAATGYYYACDSEEPVLVDPSNFMNSYSPTVYKYSKVKVYPLEGMTIKSVTANITNQDPVNIEPNEKGEYIINGNALDIWYNYGYNTTCSIDVELDGCRFTFNAEAFNGMTDPKLLVNGIGSDGEALVADPDDVTLKLGDYWGNLSTSMVITSITDTKSGRVLGYDHRTGKVTGLEADMDLKIEYKEIVKDRTLKVKVQGSKTTTDRFPTTAKMVLGSGEETNLYFVRIASTSFQDVSVNYSSEYDLPFSFKDVEYTYSGSTMRPDVFLNNEKVEYVNGAYAFPSAIPDNSTLVITRPTSARTSTVTVETQIAEIGDSKSFLNLAVDVNGEIVSDNIAENAFSKVLPAFSQVKVVNNGSTTDYTVRYSTTGSTSDLKTLPAYGVDLPLGSSSSAKVLLYVEPVMNSLTFSAAEGTDLSAISVTDENGKAYAATAGTIYLPTSVKSLKVTTSEPESYLTISSSAAGMTFDKDSGMLSGLATGTLTLTTNKVVRENEVKIFVDDEDLPGTLVLGNGKVTQTSENLSEGFQTIKFSEEDLPLIYRLAEVTSADGDDEGSLGEDSDFDPTRPETMPAVYVNGQRLEYSVEHGGYIFPVEALTGETAPVIKIYAPDPTATATPDPDDPDAPEVGGVKNITLFYLVEPGITFKAIEEYSVEVTESGMREVLPSTYVELEAQ